MLMIQQAVSETEILRMLMDSGSTVGLLVVAAVTLWKYGPGKEINRLDTTLQEIRQELRDHRDGAVVNHQEHRERIQRLELIAETCREMRRARREAED